MVPDYDEDEDQLEEEQDTSLSSGRMAGSSTDPSPIN
jgi:hypothetical protein